MQLIALFQSIIIWQQLVRPTSADQGKQLHFWCSLAKSSPKEASWDSQSLVAPHLLHYEPSWCDPVAPGAAYLLTAALYWWLTLTWYNNNYLSPQIEFIPQGRKRTKKEQMLRKQQLLSVFPPSERKERVIQCNVMGQFFTRTQPKVGSM